MTDRKLIQNCQICLQQIVENDNIDDMFVIQITICNVMSNDSVVCRMLACYASEVCVLVILRYVCVMLHILHIAKKYLVRGEI